MVYMVLNGEKYILCGSFIYWEFTCRLSFYYYFNMPEVWVDDDFDVYYLYNMTQSSHKFLCYRKADFTATTQNCLESFNSDNYDDYSYQ